MKRTKADLEAMLRCSEEWCAFWERRALRTLDGGERYEIPAPRAWR